MNARIALDYETKTASGGALFYVETLPPETVFYSLLIADRPKGKECSNAEAVLAYVTKKIDSAILQIGGEASTGKGICRVTMCGGAK
ncbi:MAG: hypothetical protein KJ893_03950 [Candidatus Omnitrophica bacterium]|nr:hypothetical protein [Candidatus Omnitrophota bacterium]MBU4478020.1 hypothetical protein [Candidatus Omnitrophota bacterium]